MSSLLNRETLCINRSWIALNITDVRTAFGLIYKNYAKMVLTEDVYDKFNNLVGSKLSAIDYDELVRISDRLPEDKYHIVHSPKYKHLAPSVIVHRTDELPSYFVKYSRASILQRDSYTCQFCYKKYNIDMLTIDHIIPKASGGSSSFSNCVACCKNCNEYKGNKSLEEVGFKLLKKPSKPQWINKFQKVVDLKNREDWNYFLKFV